MHAFTRSLMLMAALTPLPAALAANAAADTTADDFNTLFSSTCLPSFSDPARVERYMESQGIAPLPDAAAENFLHGAPGKAWAIVVNDANYAVSLTDVGLCSVYARKADTAALATTFVRLMHGVPPPLQVTEVRALGPNREGVHTRTWGMRVPDSTMSIAFTLTTSADPAVSVQAMASMARVATQTLVPLPTPAR